MTTSAVADPFERLSHIARHRYRAIGVAFGSLFGALVFVGTLVSPPAPEEVQGYLGSIVAIIAFAVVFPWVVLTYGARRRIRRLRPLGPLLADSGWPMARGIMLVLRDGMVMTFPGSALFPGGSLLCLMFFAGNGAVLHPSLEEAIRWTQVRFMLRQSRLGIVGGRKGPAAARFELESLRTQIGATGSVCVVRQRRVPAADPMAPRWMVMASFVSFSPIGLPRVDRVVPELTAIGGFMRRALGLFAPVAGAVSVGQSQ